MDIEKHMDPELRKFFSNIPPADISSDPAVSRKFFAKMVSQMNQGRPKNENVRVENRNIPGPDNAPDIPVRIYSPAEKPEALPVIVWMHGGGFLIGNLDQDDIPCRMMVEAANCVVVSVDYRLAPEHPFPAGVEDAYAALKWTASSNDIRVVIGGASAGGCIAAGVSQMARDLNGPELIFQLLLYPVLDKTHTTPSSHIVNDLRTWSREASQNAWALYLGENFKNNTAPYASPACTNDLSNLPPAYIMASELDILRDEAVNYAMGLMQAGVSTEIHVFPKTFHGFSSMVPSAAISKRANSEYIEVLKTVMNK